MQKIKAKIIVLFFIALGYCAPVLAQGCFEDNIEEELMSDLMEVKRLQNSTNQDNMDSLHAADRKFYYFLSYQGERNPTIVDDVNRLIYQGVDFSVSDDHMCNLFSWEVYSYQGLHYRSGVLFYKTSTGIHSIQFKDGVAPFSIRTIHRGGKNVYLLFYEDDYSLTGRFKMVTANVIEARFGEESFAPESFFYNSKNDSTAFLEYKYDLVSYQQPKTVPDIILSNNRKKLSIPIVKNDGSFDGKYKDYVFEGNRFMLAQEANKKK